jgi:hypothetical protein
MKILIIIQICLIISNLRQCTNYENYYKVIYIDSTSFQNSYLVKIESLKTLQFYYVIESNDKYKFIKRLIVNKNYSFKIRKLSIYLDTLSDKSIFYINTEEFNRDLCPSMVFDGTELGDYIINNQINSMTITGQPCEYNFDIMSNKQIIKFVKIVGN